MKGDEMKYDKEFGLYIAEKEDLETFCKKLITKRDGYNRTVIGEFNDISITCKMQDTLDSLITKYKAEELNEKQNPRKKHTKNDLKHNASGYYDPTAYAAIKKLDKEIKNSRNKKEIKNEN